MSYRMFKQGWLGLVKIPLATLCEIDHWTLSGESALVDGDCASNQLIKWRGQFRGRWADCAVPQTLRDICRTGKSVELRLYTHAKQWYGCEAYIEAAYDIAAEQAWATFAFTVKGVLSVVGASKRLRKKKAA